MTFNKSKETPVKMLKAVVLDILVSENRGRDMLGYLRLYLRFREMKRNHGSFESTQVTLIGSDSCKILALLVYDYRRLSDN